MSFTRTHTKQLSDSMKYVTLLCLFLLSAVLFSQTAHRDPITDLGRRYLYQGKRMSQNHLLSLLRKQDLGETLNREINSCRKMRKLQTACEVLGGAGLVEGASTVAEYYATSFIPPNKYYNREPVSTLYLGVGVMLGGLVAGAAVLPIRALRMKHARRVVELYNL